MTSTDLGTNHKWYPFQSAYFFHFPDKQLLVIYFVKVVLIFGPSMLDLRFQRNYYES